MLLIYEFTTYFFKKFGAGDEGYKFEGTLLQLEEFEELMAGVELALALGCAKGKVLIHSTFLLD